VLGAYINGLSLIAPKLSAKHAFYIFCYPFAAKLRPHQKDFLATGSVRNIAFEGKEIASYSWGDGAEKILCLHGWQSNAFRWKKFIESFNQERYTLIAVDAPGHGASSGRILNVPMYARLIAQIMEETEIDFILGHSMGCFSALHAMHDETAKRPKGAVLLAAAASAEEFVGFFKEVVGLSNLAEQELRIFFKSYAGHDVAYYETVNYAPSMDFPALIIHDREDDEIPMKFAQRLHEAWPKSELLLTDGLGHKMRHLSVINEAIDFCERHNNQSEEESIEAQISPSVFA
jgi:pimeloyl-ACP methyl ester carboxylesterase